MTKNRKPLIAGNWKMHKTIMESLELTDGIVKKLAELDLAGSVDALICPPFTALESVSNRLSQTSVKLGGQNCAFMKEGALTGEVSPLMLLDVGCEFVVLGHSERRAHFGETDDVINSKIKLALECGLVPIVCVGETLDEREHRKTFAVLRAQMHGCLAGLSIEQIAKLTVAYEPVWAIGTGRTATPETAQEAHRFIRGLLALLASEEAADTVRILYGGSVKPESAAALLAQPDIDGALVGGASLTADTFCDIITSAR